MGQTKLANEGSDLNLEQYNLNPQKPPSFDHSDDLNSANIGLNMVPLKTNMFKGWHKANVGDPWASNIVAKPTRIGNSTWRRSPRGGFSGDNVHIPELEPTAFACIQNETELGDRWSCHPTANIKIVTSKQPWAYIDIGTSLAP